MSVYENLMGQLENNDVLFNVAVEPIFTQSGMHIEGKRAIINKSNNNTVGIVSENYKVVPNVEIFDAFCRQIEASNINSEDAFVNVQFAKGGARTLVDFVFPNEQIKVAGDGSETSLSITALNSFDGSTRYLTKAGGLRMKCLNGQLLGTIAGAYSSTHTAKLSVDEGAQKIIRMLQEFRGAQDYWTSMMQTKVTDMSAHRVILEFFNQEDKENPFGNKNVQEVCVAWMAYKQELGSNAYALYNALTDWVTHKQSKSGASGRINRERRLYSTLKSDAVFQPSNQLAVAA